MYFIKNGIYKYQKFNPAEFLWIKKIKYVLTIYEDKYGNINPAEFYRDRKIKIYIYNKYIKIILFMKPSRVFRTIKLKFA